MSKTPTDEDDQQLVDRYKRLAEMLNSSGVPFDAITLAALAGITAHMAMTLAMPRAAFLRACGSAYDGMSDEPELDTDKLAEEIRGCVHLVVKISQAIGRELGPARHSRPVSLALIVLIVSTVKLQGWSLSQLTAIVEALFERSVVIDERGGDARPS